MEDAQLKVNVVLQVFKQLVQLIMQGLNANGILINADYKNALILKGPLIMNVIKSDLIAQSD